MKLPFQKSISADARRSRTPRLPLFVRASVLAVLLLGGLLGFRPVIAAAPVILAPHPINGSSGAAYLSPKPAVAELSGLSFHHAFLGPGQAGWHSAPVTSGAPGKTCSLAFGLKGRYVRLRTLAGVADGLSASGAVFRVVGDGRTLYVSPVMHSDDDPLNLDLKIAGVKYMSLSITSAEMAQPPRLVIWADPTVYPAHVPIPAPPAWPTIATNQTPGTVADVADQTADSAVPPQDTDTTDTAPQDTSADSTPDTTIDPAPTDHPSADGSGTDPAPQDTNTDRSPDQGMDPIPTSSADSVFRWSEIPENAPVPIVQAVFDENGYQLYDNVGETIVVPFIKQNLYAMKFGQSHTGHMYFVNDGTAPVLYVPPGGYLENAVVPGARWYPFPRTFHVTTPVYLGPASSWQAFEDMCWYPNMVYWGNYSSDTASGDDDSYAESPGVVFVIDGDPYYGWGAYHRYLYNHPGYHRIRDYPPPPPRWHRPRPSGPHPTRPPGEGSHPPHPPHHPGGGHSGSHGPGDGHRPPHPGGPGDGDRPPHQPGGGDHPPHPPTGGTPVERHPKPNPFKGLHPAHPASDDNRPTRTPGEETPLFPQPVRERTPREDHPAPHQPQSGPPTRHEDPPAPREIFDAPIRHEDPPAPKHEDPPPPREIFHQPEHHEDPPAPRQPEHHEDPPKPEHHDDPPPKHEDPPADKSNPFERHR